MDRLRTRAPLGVGLSEVRNSSDCQDHVLRPRAFGLSTGWYWVTWLGTRTIILGTLLAGCVVIQDMNSSSYATLYESLPHRISPLPGLPPIAVGPFTDRRLGAGSEQIGMYQVASATRSSEFRLTLPEDPQSRRQSFGDTSPPTHPTVAALVTRTFCGGAQGEGLPRV